MDVRILLVGRGFLPFELAENVAAPARRDIVEFIHANDQEGLLVAGVEQLLVTDYRLFIVQDALRRFDRGLESKSPRTERHRGEIGIVLGVIELDPNLLHSFAVGDPRPLFHRSSNGWWQLARRGVDVGATRL